MKLLFCTACNDVVRFGDRDWRDCRCGRSSARYLEDGYHAEITGDFAHALGISQHTLKKALTAQGSGRQAQPPIDGWLHDREYYRIARVASKDASRRPARRSLTTLDILDDECVDTPLPPLPGL